MCENMVAASVFRFNLTQSSAAVWRTPKFEGCSSRICKYSSRALSCFPRWRYFSAFSKCLEISDMDRVALEYPSLYAEGAHTSNVVLPERTAEIHPKSPLKGCLKGVPKVIGNANAPQIPPFTARLLEVRMQRT